MSSNSKIQITQLDFDNIKSGLKAFLQNQSQFADFNFEGSAINIFLDLLAFNTYYNAFYLNMVACADVVETPV